MPTINVQWGRMVLAKCGDIFRIGNTTFLCDQEGDHTVHSEEGRTQGKQFYRVVWSKDGTMFDVEGL